MNPLSAFVICTSHRARRRLEASLGFNPNEYFSFGKRHLVEIPTSSLLEALSIPGIKKGKWSDDFMQCWNQIGEFDVIEKGA